MSLTPEQPKSRRAAREARLATGEQPSLDAQPELEDTGSTGGQAVIGPDGQPLTRRRLRELRETGLIPTITPASTPVVEPASETGPASDAESAPLAQTAPQPDAHFFRPSSPIAAERPAAPQADLTPATGPTPAPAPAPESELRTTKPQPDLSKSAFAPRSEPTAPAAAPSWTAPEGHWTRQLELEDDVEMTASREVGGPSTSSALVVEELPKVVDLGGPLGETGQVLLTGSITLSPDFAATGAITGLHGEAELDDRFDSAHPTTGSSAAPVKASAVASQHALGTPIVAGGKPRASRAINVLIVTAAVLAVLVTGLVVTAVVLRWI